MSVYRDKIELDISPGKEVIQILKSVQAEQALESAKFAAAQYLEIEKAKAGALKKLDYYVGHALPKIKRAAQRGKGELEYGGSWWRPLDSYSAECLVIGLTNKDFKCFVMHTSSAYFEYKVKIVWG